MRRVLIAGALVATLLACGAGVAAIRGWLSPRTPGAPELLFTVSRGESLADIARNLERAGLVRSGRAVTWLARWRGLEGELRAGEYALSPALPPGEILARIAEGRVATYQVVLPEGFSMAQIAARLEAAQLADAEQFLEAARDPATAAAMGVEGETLEGYLFPETYRIPRGLAPDEIAGILVAQLLQVWDEIEPRAREQGLSMRDVVTLASIVEKETAVAEERPLIASVFRNRLKRGMRLETDPTVIYGIPDFDGNLRRRDLDDRDNPYNTYQFSGLPPGPIASPGADALRAVVAPAETDYLYFVSRNDGTHAFSSSYRQHVLAVNRYQKGRSR
jgi:UPF0755 protein